MLSPPLETLVMRQRFVLGSAAMLVLTVGLAYAQDKPAGSQTGGRDGDKAGTAASDQNTVRNFVQRQDKNKDGALSRNELPADMRDGFKELDKNNDGKLDASELRSHAARMQACMQPVEVVTIWTIEAVDPVTKDELQAAYDQLRQLDKNNDGKIGDDEVKAAREQAIAKRINTAFERMDANDDGKLSKQEALGHPGFAQADKDNDGSVSKHELKAAIMQDGAASGPGAGTAEAKDK